MHAKPFKSALRGRAYQAVNKHCMRIVKSLLKTLMVYTLAFLALILISYVALHALPGDPILHLFADYELNAGSMRYQRLQEMYGGSSRGALSGLRTYCQHLLRGELGFSLSYAAPVREVIADVLPWTWLLTLITAPLALLFSYLLGVEAAMRHGRYFDGAVLMFNNLINAVPSFVKAVIVFFIFLSLCPELPLQGAYSIDANAQGWRHIGDITQHLIAPVSVLWLSEVGKLLLPIRAGALVVLAKPYMTTATLKGLSGWRLRHAYVGANIKGIIVVRGAMLLVSLLSGSIFVETIFAYPGIGLALYQGIGYRDYALVQGIILLLSLHILALHFIADIAVDLINRRG